jgi:hypothetical protein
MTEKENQRRMKPSANRKQEAETDDQRPLASADDKEADDKEAWIGRQLRAVYDETLHEPIPERFLELLDKIDKKDPDSK